jgi:hypothetical protein
MKKSLLVFCGLTLGLTLLTGCLLQKPKTIKPQELRVWWGNKEEIKSFLDRPEATANRWVVEAVGQ